MKKTEERMNTEEAARFLRVRRETLTNWRYQKTGPKFYKLGDGPRGRVFYLLSDLQRYVMERRVED